MYGGNNSLTGTAYYGDTWILTFANGIGGTPAWTLEKVSGTAPQRHFHSAFYVPTDNDMIIFGGQSMISQSPWDDRAFILSVANDL